MKKKLLQKILSTTASLMACTFLIGNAIPVPTLPEHKHLPITIDIPVLDNDKDSKNESPAISLLNDENSFNEFDD